MLLVYANLNLGMGGGVLAATTFRQALQAQLLAIPALSALVGAHVYPGVLPRTHDLEKNGPAVTALVTADLHLGHHIAGIGHTLSGRDGTMMVRVQISGWSYRESDVDAIGEALFAALDPLINVQWGTVKIVTCVREQQVDLPEPATAANPRDIYRIVNEFHVRYRTP